MANSYYSFHWELTEGKEKKSGDAVYKNSSAVISLTKLRLFVQQEIFQDMSGNLEITISAVKPITIEDFNSRKGTPHGIK